MLENSLLDELFCSSLEEQKEKSTYRLNFGVYYTPRF